MRKGSFNRQVASFELSAYLNFMESAADVTLDCNERE